MNKVARGTVESRKQTTAHAFRVTTNDDRYNVCRPLTIFSQKATYVYGHVGETVLTEFLHSHLTEVSMRRNHAKQGSFLGKK